MPDQEDHGEEMPGPDAGDDPAGGLPPHPLDRVWFHPSELGAYMAATPEPRRERREWTVPAMAAIAGAVITLVALAAAGALDGGGSTTAVDQSAVAPGVTGLTDPVERVVALGGAAVVAVRVASTDPNGATVNASGVAVGRTRVLTAANVVNGGGTIRISVGSGRVFTGEVAGVDPETDLALIRLQRGELEVASFGSADGLRVGQSVITLGSAGGDRHWTSRGVIAALDRLVGLDNDVLLAGLIETDVDTTDTAWGGALLDADGRVIGIMSGAAPGRAVPIDVARDVADQLAATGRARHGWLGVGASDAGDLHGGGARIETIAPGSPAEAAGLRRGDVVTSIGTARVTDTSDLMAAMLRRRPGDPVGVGIWRGEKEVRKQVSLGEKAPAPGTMGTP